MPIPIQLNTSKLYLYSNGKNIAWAADKNGFRKFFPGNFCYRAAHDESQQIPEGWEAIGNGLADTYIRRKHNAMKSLISSLSPR